MGIHAPTVNKNTEKRLERIEGTQRQLNDHYNDEELENIILIDNIPDQFRDSTLKSRQTTIKGDSFMTEMKPDLSDEEVVERPANTTIKECEVVEWVEGSRQEIFDMDDDDEPKYGSLDDQLIQIEVRAEDDDGNSFTVRDIYRRHETISDRQDLGKFLNTYGHPEEGMEVEVFFDDDGQGSIVLPD